MSQIDHRWIKILTIAVQGIICLALYFARTCCFLLNSLFALFKILFILVLAIAGFVATRHPDSGTRDYSKRHAEFDSFKALAGMIHVIYTYEGWEYTNFVRTPSHRGCELANRYLRSLGRSKHPKKLYAKRCFCR